MGRRREERLPCAYNPWTLDRVSARTIEYSDTYRHTHHLEAQQMSYIVYHRGDHKQSLIAPDRQFVADKQRWVAPSILLENYQGSWDAVSGVVYFALT